MLTRSQVARRIGKSIATVRRLEGSQLHPTQDHVGIHRFDETEVDQLAIQIRKSGRALDSDSALNLKQLTSRQSEVERVQSELEATRLYVADLEEKLGLAQERARDPFYDAYTQDVDVQACIEELQECCLWLLRGQRAITTKTHEVSERLDDCFQRLGGLARPRPTSEVG